MKTFIRFLKDEDGVTVIEYGLIAAITIFGIVAIAATLRGDLSEVWSRITSSVSASNT